MCDEIFHRYYWWLKKRFSYQVSHFIFEVLNFCRCGGQYFRAQFSRISWRRKKRLKKTETKGAGKARGKVNDQINIANAYASTSPILFCVKYISRGRSRRPFIKIATISRSARCSSVYIYIFAFVLVSCFPVRGR